MPCNLVAIRKAKANVTPGLVLDNPQVITGMKNMLAQLFGVTTNDITTYNDKNGSDWGIGWNEWRKTKQGAQIPVAQLVSANTQYIDWVCNKCAVRLTRDGEITLRDGWDLPSSKHFSPEQFEQILAQVNAGLNQVLGLLFQQQVQTALAKQGRIENVQAMPTGAIVITMEI
ncbi:hypothetical protein ANRL1_00852 [Anaerolineae bacterium]|nr:hypothetical protein ANRL1_00852 [Anaerolineae bacterium]